MDAKIRYNGVSGTPSILLKAKDEHEAYVLAVIENNKNKLSICNTGYSQGKPGVQSVLVCIERKRIMSKPDKTLPLRYDPKKGCLIATRDIQKDELIWMSLTDYERLRMKRAT